MRATRPGAILLATGLLSLGTLTANAYEVPAAPFSGGATTVMPGSGLRQTITVSGQTELGDPATAGVRGIGPATYRPAIPTGTPAQDVVVNTGDCASTGGCGDRGTVTIAFSQPVRNPVLHLGGLGGSVTRTVSGRTVAQSELHAILKLGTAGLSLTKVGAGNNLAVTSDTITAVNHDTGPNCVNTKSPSGLDTSATAACGSVRVNGVVTKVSFNVSAVFTKHPKLPPLNNGSSGDAFSIVASAPENFSHAPASYGSAWSVLSDVRLGKDAPEDNPDVPNSTTGPVTPRPGDGVVLEPLHTGRTSYSADLQLTGASKAGRACGWIDFNVNGVFDPGERACASFAAKQPKVTLQWSAIVPKAGTSYARVRVGYTAAQVERPTGAADAGEVEDYPFAITPPPPPVLTDDTATTGFGAAVIVKVLANDKPGDPAAQLVPGTLCIVDNQQCTQMVNVVGQAKYVANADGTVRVEPVPGFVGTAKPVTYRVADSNGTTGTAKLTVTVSLPDHPVAIPDTATTPQNVSVSVKPLANDHAAAGVQLVPGSVVLRDPADATFKKQVAIPGEGTYVVKPDGGVDFIPKPQFTGVGTSIGYRVADTTHQTAESTLTVTVTPVTPVANGDSVSTAFDTAVVVPVLDNDLPGSPDAPLVPATLRLVDPVNKQIVDNLTVPGQGTYLVAAGKVTFDPVHGFTGVGTPITYQVLDKNGTAARAELTVSVAAPGPPVANEDTVTTLQGRTTVVPVLDNDKPGPTGAALKPGTVRLLTATQPVLSLVVPGQGKYLVRADGKVLFDPLPSFSGTATAIGYQVADSNGAIGRSTLTVRVTKVQPDASDDTATTAYGTRVTARVLANDDPGDPSVPLVPSTVRLIDPTTKLPTATLVVPGQATYTTTPDGTIEVAPAPKFTGAATPVTYRVADVNGTTTTATLTVTVAKPAPPTAEPDTATGKQNVPLRLSPLANDLPGVGTVLDPHSLTLVDPADGSLKKLVKVPGQATYEVGPDGTVAVDPLPAFTGTGAKVTYRVADEFGQTARSTITVTIAPVTPVAADDTARTPYGKRITVSVLANDKPGDPTAPLVPGSLQLVDPADGRAKEAVRIPNEGEYTAVGGAVRFDPSATFRGPGTPLTYQVADTNGTKATARLTVTVGQPPVAIADTASTKQNVTVTVNVLSNDRPGTDAKLDRGSVVLNESAKTLTVANQGTYTVRPSGAIAFDPLPAFRGKAAPVTYRVADSDGNYAASTLTITVVPVTPVVLNDSAITPYGHPITVNVLANDKPGDPSAPLQPASVVLKDGQDAPDGHGGQYGKTLTRPGEGTYAVDAYGAVKFTPAKGFHGVTTPTTYRVSDANGTTAEGLLLLTVGQGPKATPDPIGTKQNVTVTVDPLANDKPGTGAQLVPATLQLYGATWGTKVAIPGQGVFTVKSGKITFDPEPAYRGVVSVAYRVEDTTGNLATSTVTVTVAPVVPVIKDDLATTPYETATTVDVLANDTPGDPSAPLVAGGVRLIDPVTGAALPALVVPGEGTFTVQPSGAIRFAPLDGYAGVAVPVGYQVADRNGTIGSGTLTITVQARPIAIPDVARTKQHVAVTVDPLANDRPGPGATLDPESLLLVGPDGALVDQVTVPGQGSYVVADGKVTFSPEPTFSGTAQPATYEVKDSDQNAARSTITVTVVPVRPVVVDDSVQTAFGTPVVVNVLGNDKPGDLSAPLRQDSVVLRDPADGKEKKSVTVPREGTFVVGDGGAVRYTPAKDFVGTTRALVYRVSDANDTSDTALLDVTVASPLLAKAAPDTATGTPGNPVTVNPLLNDSGTIRPSSVCLRTPTGTCSKNVTNGAGTWSVGTDGTVTLKPVAAFTGTAKVTYERTDEAGETVTAPVKFTVGAEPADESYRSAAAELTESGGPPAFILTLGVLLAALGATLVVLARTRR
ncbi:Ig-like domain-containing protein [Kribbella sp.]|uniref:Ig-like domain-containing protein n=1 Tax=Kribbella sp. TaxID=1871183 RepID=UPI002D4E9AA5|nr:Ig-like domain-containing protein [Kribbella sp.]HZX04795.1 Ig-like domain-containing protein [Kribbella sp.]